jgi:hypothetical protein
MGYPKPAWNSYLVDVVKSYSSFSEEKKEISWALKTRRKLVVLHG